MAASWDSADLLLQFGQKAGRPTSGDSVTDAAKYARLSRSQNRVIAMLAPVAPFSLYPKVAYGSLPTLTTTDNQVYTFGTDSNSYANFPMGHAGIYRSLSDIPDFPLIEGGDYMNEGTQIRATGNTTLPAVLYWYGIAQPADIDATDQPAMFPEASRDLIVIDAVRQFSMEGKRDLELAAAMAAEWSLAWPTWCTVWKTQFRSGGALSAMTGRDLAIGTAGAWQPGY